MNIFMHLQIEAITNIFTLWWQIKVTCTFALVHCALIPMTWHIMHISAYDLFNHIMIRTINV